MARIVDGEVAVTGLGAVPELDETTAERLEATVRSWDLRDGRVLDEVELIIEGRARYPLLLTQPQAPLGALLDAVDLAMTRRGVVPAELADEMDDTSSTDALIEHLREERDLDAPQLAAVLGVQRVVLQLQNELLRSELVAWRDQAEGDPDPVPASPAEALAGLWDAPVEESADSKTQVDREVTRGDLATVLADREAAMALVEDILDDDPFAAACLLAVLDSAAPTTKDRRLRAELAWVRARTLELTADDHAEAERELRRATELDPSHGPATFDLAGYLSDRGQAGAALGLLIGMEGPGVDELVEFLTPFAGAGPMSAGRNEPCPCGSGRKHKACCAVRGGWPLRARMPWLMRKVMTFYTSAAARDTVLDVALSAGMAEEGAAGSYRDTATLNLALFEGGVIADLCDLRGSLLPADELELLRDWSRVRSSLLELVEADADGTCTLLDLLDGERTTFADESLAARLEVGDAVLAWLVTDEAGTAPFHSVVPVPDRERVRACSTCSTMTRPRRCWRAGCASSTPHPAWRPPPGTRGSTSGRSTPCRTRTRPGRCWPSNWRRIWTVGSCALSRNAAAPGG